MSKFIKIQTLGALTLAALLLVGCSSIFQDKPPTVVTSNDGKGSYTTVVIPPPKSNLIDSIVGDGVGALIRWMTGGLL
jgi:hypothetical protein